MASLGGAAVKALSDCARVVHWTIAPVDDRPEPPVTHMPGPAHGPVPAIEVRLEGRQKPH